MSALKKIRSLIFAFGHVYFPGYMDRKEKKKATDILVSFDLNLGRFVISNQLDKIAQVSTSGTRIDKFCWVLIVSQPFPK